MTTESRSGSDYMPSLTLAESRGYQNLLKFTDVWSKISIFGNHRFMKQLSVWLGEDVIANTDGGTQTIEIGLDVRRGKNWIEFYKTEAIKDGSDLPVKHRTLIIQEGIDLMVFEHPHMTEQESRDFEFLLSRYKFVQSKTLMQHLPRLKSSEYTPEMMTELLAMIGGAVDFELKKRWKLERTFGEQLYMEGAAKQ